LSGRKLAHTAPRGTRARDFVNFREKNYASRAKDDFENYFTNLKIDLKEYCEFSIFPLSGGVTAKTPMPRLPIFVLKCFNFLDKIVVRLFSKKIALGMRVVISRK
jgi:hypothetical protein